MALPPLNRRTYAKHQQVQLCSHIETDQIETDHLETDHLETGQNGNNQIDSNQGEKPARRTQEQRAWGTLIGEGCFILFMLGLIILLFGLIAAAAGYLA